MQSVSIIFPHQLFKNNTALHKNREVYLVEEHLFFNQYKFHQQKIAFHRASMQRYADYLKQQDYKINYIDAQQGIADIRKLIPHLINKGVEDLHFINPTDNWLEKRIDSFSNKVNLHEYENPLFLNTRQELKTFFKPSGKKFFQTKFYIQERKRLNILIDKDDNPLGGKWSYDAENRKKYPADKQPPAVTFPEDNQYYKGAKEYTLKHYSNNPGDLKNYPLYPVNYNSSRQWLNNFFEQRFYDFGVYEDAIVKHQSILNHSVLTPMLNVGLLLPGEVVDAALKFAKENDIPLNSTEGFVRQIIGWREFIRGVYEAKGTQERTTNYWGFTRKIPASFYDGTTGIEPIDTTIKKVLATGYCHHIERLMILGNYMLLCEFDPDEVYRWFMELFIDSYDWVMVTNVYGMSQFADGGLMATKPYISGSNYLMKMSDYKKGDWQQTWDALFWRFMHTHRDFFTKNPRLGMLVRSFDKMDDKKQQNLLTTAEEYLNTL